MDWNRNTKGVRIVRAVQAIIERLRDYWPLTLRQIHYQLINDKSVSYSNTKGAYSSLSTWIYAARVDGIIPWTVMDDKTRRFMDLSGFESVEDFWTQELDAILESYTRNLLQTQGQQIEIWTEKEALVNVLARFAAPFRVSVQYCRGFASGDQLQDYVKRMDKESLILYFGDHDPSGMWMSEEIAPRLKEKHEFDGNLKRIALTRSQVDEYGLSPDYQIPKPKDSRTPWYRKRFGNQCWELDALSPAVLGALVQRAIQTRIDAKLFKVEQEVEKSDLSEISEQVEQIRDLLDL